MTNYKKKYASIYTNFHSRDTDDKQEFSQILKRAL